MKVTFSPATMHKDSISTALDSIKNLSINLFSSTPYSVILVHEETNSLWIKRDLLQNEELQVAYNMVIALR